MEKNLEFIGEQLKKLTAIPSPSSYTEKAAEYLMETLKEMGYEPELSNKGNVLVTIGGIRWSWHLILILLVQWYAP